jgi:OFA family oxalate/formate antiporter-like MFS transporter
LIQSKTGTDRNLIAAAAVIMQICLGAVYGYSVLIRPIMDIGHWSQAAVAVMFETAIFCLGIACLIGGIWQDKVGPRTVAMTGGVLYGLGLVVAGYGVNARSLMMIIVGYGVISGFGIGLAYITPVATLVKWFPDKRGVVTGLAVAGFGVGAIIMTLFVSTWMPRHGVASTLLWMGIGYGVIVTLGAATFRDPPAGWRPEGWEPAAAGALVARESYSPDEALRTPQYWMLWVMLFLNVCAGLMIISTLKPMATETVGMTSAAATSLVGFMGLFNGGGRLFWAWASDRIGRARVFLVMYLMQAVLFGLLLVTRNVALFAAVTALIYLCYGGGFGTMPSFTADYFGPKSVGTIYGSILVAWGIGGVVSPLLITYLRQTTGSYRLPIGILAVVMLVAVVLPLMIRPPAKRVPLK